MRRRTRLVSRLFLTAALALSAQRAPAADANPEDGTLVDGVYANAYFALRWPLPVGWKAGLQPPRPSYSGYYVLNTPTPPAEVRATILVAAQDSFFAAEPQHDAAALAKELARWAEAADHRTIEPTIVTIAGRSFARIAIAGDPLSRIVLATDIRCHVLIFTFTGAEPELLAKLAGSLEGLTLAAPAPPFPACVKGYATRQTILRRVEPVPAGPKFLKIPVRVVIGSDGRTRHIHVIRAFPEQQKNVEDALAQWEFKPYRENGQPAEIETGLVFEFKPRDQQK